MTCCREMPLDVVNEVTPSESQEGEIGLTEHCATILHGPLQLAVHAIEQCLKYELQAMKANQDTLLKRQAQLEKALKDWMMASREASACSILSPKRMSWPDSEEQEYSVATSTKNVERLSAVVQRSTSFKKRPSRDSNTKEGSSQGDSLRVPAEDGITTHGTALNSSPESSVEITETGPDPNAILPENSGPVVVHRISTELERSWMQKIVLSAHFDMLIGALIVLNSIAIGAEIEYKTTHAETDTFFMICSFLFAVIFAVELTMRFLAASHVVGCWTIRDLQVCAYKYCTGPEYLWNLFDVIMVVISLTEVIDTLVTSGKDVETSEGIARLLRIVRMVRLMRIVRVLRFSPPLRMMLFMILESMKSLGWLACILITILYVFSIIFTMGATEYIGVPGDSSYKPDRKYSIEVARHYGTVMRSLYTCFKSMTGGQSWGEVMDPLVDINFFYVCIFLLYIAFSVLALLNIITGVFVDGCFAKAQNDRDLVVEHEIQQKKAILANLKALFEESDVDGSKSISHEEFKEHMSDEKVQAYLGHLSVDTSNIDELFEMLDKDGSGFIEIDEFVENLLHLIRGQTVEQYVQKLMNENRRVQHHLFKFMDFAQSEFEYMREWAEKLALYSKPDTTNSGVKV